MGIPDPDWLAERISAATLGEWDAFERSFGPILLHERIDVAGALVAAVLSGKPIEDVMPRWDAAEEAPEAGVSFIEGLAAQLGKEVRRT